MIYFFFMKVIKLIKLMKTSARKIKTNFSKIIIGGYF